MVSHCQRVSFEESGSEWTKLPSGDRQEVTIYGTDVAKPTARIPRSLSLSFMLEARVNGTTLRV